MRIKLDLNGQIRSYIMSRPKLKIVKELTRLQKQSENNYDETAIDDMEAFIVNAFDNQFTIDELEEGLYSEDFVPLIQEMTETIMGVKLQTEETESGKNLVEVDNSR